jgi:hypothetical protein
LARFYNSQATAHIGYLITSIVIYAAIFNILQPLQAFENLLHSGAFWSSVVTLIAFFFFVLLWAYAPFLSRYQLARTQFYMELSQIVWEHMGVNNQEVFEPFRTRATGSGMAIQYSVMTLFEARLYRSLWKKRHGREPPQTDNGQRWLDSFHVNQRLFGELFGKSCPQSADDYEKLIKSKEYKLYLSSYEDRPLLGFWRFRGFDYADLLWTAHSRGIKRYLKGDERLLAFQV